MVGDIAVKGAALKGGVISGDLVPLLIDELPMLAALGPYTEQGIEIRDAAELRVKESDRIAALAENLKRMGATVEERPDGLRVRWPQCRTNCTVPKSSRTAITASPWPSRWQAWPPKAKPSSATPIAREYPIRLFSRNCAACQRGETRCLPVMPDY